MQHSDDEHLEVLNGRYDLYSVIIVNNTQMHRMHSYQANKYVFK